MAFKMAGAVGIRAGSPTPFAPKGPEVSGASMATGSPIKRTFSSQRTGWPFRSPPIRFVPGISLWVKTATAPGWFFALSVRILRILAWGRSLLLKCGPQGYLRFKMPALQRPRNRPCRQIADTLPCHGHPCKLLQHPA